MRYTSYMAAKERVAILVDGSNFYHYVKELQLTQLLQFDYGKLAKYLARDRTIVSSTYYIGRVRTDGSQRSQELRSNQQRLTSSLRNSGWEVSYGHLLKTGGIFHEKGVDVQIAVDLLRGTYKDFYDTALLVSSDNDLIPAIKEVRTEGKKVEYVGFSHRPSFGIMRHADIRNLLKPEDLKQFLPQ